MEKSENRNKDVEEGKREIYLGRQNLEVEEECQPQSALPRFQLSILSHPHCSAADNTRDPWSRTWPGSVALKSSSRREPLKRGLCPLGVRNKREQGRTYLET